MAAYNNINGTQMKMFMTPREIMGQYQPLDADRESYGGSEDANGTGNSTERSHNTAGMTNPYNSRNFEGSSGHAHYQRASTPGGIESDDELWDRKYDEAEYDREGPDKFGGRTNLVESIRQTGVQNPVHLSTRQFGSQGMPEILGGHHRLAVANAVAPDQPIPVLHSTDMWDARSRSNADAGFRYS